jgi:3-oxoacyl-[acyl-carrier protein] reductase
MSKIIIITGSSKGIGKYLTEYYLNNGNTVFGCSRGEATLVHNNYKHFSLDVSNEKSVKKMFNRIRKDYKKLDVLINNAGIASMNHSLLTRIDTVHKILNTNVVGTFLFCREAAKLMQKTNNGRIINFSTVAVPMNLEGEAIYASSKSAVVSLTKILAQEFSNYNITVNAIGPTPIKTDLIKSVPKEKINDLINRQAIKRFGNFDDVVNVLDFYINDRSSFITGQSIYLGGV